LHIPAPDKSNQKGKIMGQNIRLVLSIGMIGLNTQICGADTLHVASDITEVTVYFEGAQVTRHLNKTVGLGTYLLLLDNLPYDLDDKSIQVSALDGLEVLSVHHEPHTLSNPKKSKEELILEERLEAIDFQKMNLDSETKMLNTEEGILLDNRKLSNGRQALNVEEIEKAADFFHERLNALRKKKLEVHKKQLDLFDQIEEINKQLSALQAARFKMKSRVIIRVKSAKPQELDLHVTYFTRSAGWTPSYDFKVTSISSPMEIGYNAQVYQTTGEDWDEVTVHLSTGNPSLSGIQPTLKPWYLEDRDPNYEEKIVEGAGTLKGTVFEARDDEVVPFANILCKKGDQVIVGTVSDFDGRYTLKPLESGHYDLHVQCVGYQTKIIKHVAVNGEKITFQDVTLDGAIALEELTVVAYERPLIDRDGGASGGTVTSRDIHRMPLRDASNIANTVAGVGGARSSAKEYYIDGIRVMGNSSIPQSSIETVEVYGYQSSTNSTYISAKSKKFSQTELPNTQKILSHTLKKRMIDIEYAIEVPYTIPSDGKEYFMPIKLEQVAVDYTYYIIPKVEQDAFLTASVPDWSSLNLISGKASIFLNGKYTGESQIDSEYTGDTLKISLGRDRNIVVERLEDKTINQRQFLGSNIKEQVGWEIKLRNNHSSEVDVVVLDQVPITRYKTISISNVVATGAKYIEKTGSLTWRKTIPPESVHTINYQYELKYPSGAIE
jgi:hypothetical protein